MQPSNIKGKKLRIALIPLSWVVAGFMMYAILLALSKISNTSIRELLSSDSLWPLLVFLPGIMFGKVVGLMLINCIAYLILPFHLTFEEEVSITGRQNFAEAMSGLGKMAVWLGILLLLSCFLFLYFR